MTPAKRLPRIIRNASILVAIGLLVAMGITGLGPRDERVIVIPWAIILVGGVVSLGVRIAVFLLERREARRHDD